MSRYIKKHFSDLAIGERFRIGLVVYEKTNPIYETGKAGRGRYRGNCRSVKTGNVTRGNFGLVEVVK